MVFKINMKVYCYILLYRWSKFHFVSLLFRQIYIYINLIFPWFMQLNLRPWIIGKVQKLYRDYIAFTRAPDSYFTKCIAQQWNGAWFTAPFLAYKCSLPLTLPFVCNCTLYTRFNIVCHLCLFKNVAAVKTWEIFSIV